jgi:serine/threonine-protein kinase HSL1 (negative regulator of Swe1 kinase)
MRYFRQILSAIGFCHSFNICHRDLKPENILVNKSGNIKIADFGMAALQQSPEHRLQTSCGSPHYAAPEVIRAGPYRGNKVDIWSIGIILFAELSGFLPFDNESLPALLGLIQKGRYSMPGHLSIEAQDLIYRMLQVNPQKRASIEQIWRHPLLQKYDYLDSFGGGAAPTASISRDCGRPVTRRSDIDKELLRHLRSMWHTLDEAQIIKLLLNDEYVYPSD